MENFPEEPSDRFVAFEVNYLLKNIIDLGSRRHVSLKYSKYMSEDKRCTR